jgi:hypothetical protein
MTSTKPTIRRILLVAGVVLAALTAGSGVYAATRPPTFELTVASGQTAFGAGQMGGYRVDVKRIRGFKSPIRLRAAKLPEGAVALWQLPDGRQLPLSKGAAVLAGRHTRAFLIVTATTQTTWVRPSRPSSPRAARSPGARRSR